MQKAFEKIIEKLKEETYDMEICEEQFDTNSPYFKDVPYKMVKMDDVKEIINQVASEYAPEINVGKNEEVCEWRLCDEEANVYDTTCRNPHILLEGSPIDNNYEFCPYCGKKIKVVQPKGE